jgi:hypothetical protein
MTAGIVRASFEHRKNLIIFKSCRLKANEVELAFGTEFNCQEREALERGDNGL